MAETVLVVLGMHRSGTSLCAHMLHALGADMADGPGASPDNARGHWERPRINDLNDAVFAALGRSWSDSAHLLALPERWMEEPRVKAAGRDLAAFLRVRIAAAGGRPWGFKDPRTARLMPLWRLVWSEAGVTPRFVLCLRHPAQVARSLARRDRLASGQAVYRWVQYVAGAVCGIGADPVCIVPYDAWFGRAHHAAGRLARFAGLPEPADGLADGIVAPDLRHDEAGAAPVAPLAAALYDLLTADPDAAVMSASARESCASFTALEHLIQPMLVDAEIQRASVRHQNRVIADLETAIRDLRQRAAA